MAHMLLHFLRRSHFLLRPPFSLSLYTLCQSRVVFFPPRKQNILFDLSRPPSVGAITRISPFFFLFFFFYPLLPPPSFPCSSFLPSSPPSCSSSSTSTTTPPSPPSSSSSSYLVGLYESRTVLKEVAPFNRACSVCTRFPLSLGITAITSLDISLSHLLFFVPEKFFLRECIGKIVDFFLFNLRFETLLLSSNFFFCSQRDIF